VPRRKHAAFAVAGVECLRSLVHTGESRSDRKIEQYAYRLARTRARSRGLSSYFVFFRSRSKRSTYVGRLVAALNVREVSAKRYSSIDYRNGTMLTLYHFPGRVQP
jgi:hypothetical protein